MASDSPRRLSALVEIASERTVTQRSLASLLNISLGSSNAVLRELELDKRIKVKRGLLGTGAQYALTASGQREMLARSKQAALNSSDALEPFKIAVTEEAEKLANSKGKKVLLCASGAVADVVVSAFMNAGLKISAVVSDDEFPEKVIGKRVKPITDANKVQCDFAVALSKPDAALLRKHVAKGVRVVQLLSRIKEPQA